MENMKQEYAESHYSNYDLIVKKEEDIAPKLEVSSHNHPPCISYYNNQMVVPWLVSCAKFPSLPPDPSEYFTNFTRFQQKYMGKPFTIIRNARKDNSLFSNINYYGLDNQDNEDDKFINVKIEQPSKRNQCKVTFCKNYIGLLCSGFARTVLTSKYGSDITDFIKTTLAQKKMKYGSLRNQADTKLIDSFRSHIHKMMCGKKIRKGNKERDFKIRNTRELQKLWKILDKDSELTRLKKEVLREVAEYFFESDCYVDWLSNAMMTPENRNFFICNKDAIKNKFLYPGVYKPKFNRNLE